MLRTFKYRLYPNTEQKQLLSKAFGCVRFVYNNSLAFKKYKYETENKSISKFDLINRIVSLKSEFEFLLETPSQALQQSIVHPKSARRPVPLGTGGIAASKIFFLTSYQSRLLCVI